MKSFKPVFLVIALITIVVLACVGAVTTAQAFRPAPASSTEVSCETAVFDASAGVQFYPALGSYAATGTRKEAIVFSPGEVITFADKTTVEFIPDVRGGKTVGYRGWRHSSGKTIITGGTGENYEKPSVVCDGNSEG